MRRWRTSIFTIIGLLLLSFDVSRAAPPVADATFAQRAGITRLEITSIESPTFEGRAFGGVGTYEKLRGRAYGEVDPDDPRNQVITDLALAPRNARERVEYAMDFYILRPVDPAKGNHKLFYEANNRGLKLFGALNMSSGGNDPKTASDAGEAFLLNQGYTLAWSGWDPTAPAGDDNLTISAPVARLPNGSAVTGPGFESFTFDDGATLIAPLTYPAANADQGAARLTVRDHLADARIIVPRAAWAFVDERHIRLAQGAAFRQGAIYEFSYVARDPVVGGTGFAATRDFVAFLRYGTAGNPLAGDIGRTVAFAISQPARYMNDFISLGFNADANGRRVFDGVETWLGSGAGVALNVRFGQPWRTERARRDHLFPESVFPFAYASSRDPHTGRVDGRNARCSASGTCPKMVLINSSNEYWAKTASLLHADSEGRDLPEPDNVRAYLVSSVDHSVSGSPPGAGICAQPRNPTDSRPVLRALFVALDQWLDGIEPPASRVPRISDGTGAWIRTGPGSAEGAGVVDARELGWPPIPDVNFTGTATLRNRLDFGPSVDQGGASLDPPRASAETYGAFVPKVDADGLDIAGIRLPPVAAPVATLTGWGVRAPEFGGPDACEQSGQSLAFAATRAERRLSADPRLSIEERYPTHAAYVAAVTSAARRLEADRLLLPLDVERYIAAAQARAVGR